MTTDAGLDTVPTRRLRPGASAATGKIRCDIAYDGTDFAGWAKQTGQRTVCGVLEEKLSTVFEQPINLVVAGRTDAGVHAEGQVAHAVVTEVPADLPRYVRRLSRFIPDDVRVLSISEAHPAFDARFSALRRHYVYRFSLAPSGPLPLQNRFVVGARPTVDVPAMNLACGQLVGLHDFAAFCRFREGATTISELQRFDWVREGDLLTAYVSADAFCWSMVRSLVGAAMAVGEGRRDGGWLGGLLGETSRSSDFAAAPARGLSLVGVDYPPEAELKARNLKTRDVREAAEVEGCCGD